ncbi:MAG: molybdopterin cofactor-binding domain-containing protein [Rhodomicrobiaceae bacterium]
MSTPANQDASPDLRGNLRSNPVLSKWVRLRPEGVVEVHPGKVEIGQGILTALAQLAADELDVALERIRLVPANTVSNPNEGMTSGSMSIQDSGMAVRQACAEARAIFLAAAAERLGVPAETLTVEDGIIRGQGNLSVSYFDMAEDGLLDRKATGAVAPKPVVARRVAGRSVARLDLPDKVFGAPRYIHDLVLPGMLHGRTLRPSAPGSKLIRLDADEVRQMPGVRAVVRDGSFAGVVADTEWHAAEALARLRKLAIWEEPAPQLPDEAQLPAWLKAARDEPNVVVERNAPSTAAIARTVRRDYSKPYIAHASIGPSCGIAQFDKAEGGKPVLRAWTHSQGIFNLQKDLTVLLAMPAEDILIEHREGAGCYGHNGADDVVLDAVLLARAVAGSPVRVQWSREEELGWAPFGPAMTVSIEADLDETGAIQAWRHDVWSNGHTSRPGRGAIPTLLAASDLEKPFPRLPAILIPFAGGGGAERNAVPPYDIPSLKVTNHYLTDMPIRTSALRSLGAFANVFAAESFMDELAAEAGEDPVAFRLRQLSDSRARAVIEAAAERFGWTGRQKREGVGHGIGYARYKGRGAYCAVLAEVEAGREVRVRRLVIGVDVGEAINPDGLANQIEGGAIQGTSWALKEAVRFDRTHIISDNWEAYPILQFSEVPAVEVVICNHPEEPVMGAGEASQGPTAAAIANALYDAIGVRVHELPLTPERIIAAMG